MIAQWINAQVGVSMLAVWFVIALVAFVGISILAVIAQMFRGDGGNRNALAIVLLGLVIVPLTLLLLVFLNVSRESASATIEPARIVVQQSPMLPQVREVAPAVEPPPPLLGQPPSQPPTPIDPTQGARENGVNSTTTVLVQAESMPESIHVVPDIWQLSDGELFTASFYHSYLAAAAPLANKLANQLRESNDDEVGDPDTIRIAAVLLAIDQDALLMERFSSRIRREFPKSKVLVMDPLTAQPMDEPEPGVVTMLLRVEDFMSIGGTSEVLGSGRGKLICYAHTSKGDVVSECEFIEKTWLENFDAFVSQNPSKRYVIGYSTAFVSSESEARYLAMQNAIAKSRIAIGPRPYVMISDDHVVDRFAQKLSRPYGEVWREAVLVDVSPHRVAPVISAARVSLAQRQNQRRSELKTVAILLAFTALLCVALNAISQGYFGRPIVIGILAFVVLVVLTIFWRMGSTEARTIVISHANSASVQIDRPHGPAD